MVVLAHPCISLSPIRTLKLPAKEFICAGDLSEPSWRTVNALLTSEQRTGIFSPLVEAHDSGSPSWNPFGQRGGGFFPRIFRKVVCITNYFDPPVNSSSRGLQLISRGDVEPAVALLHNVVDPQRGADDRFVNG